MSISVAQRYSYGAELTNEKRLIDDLLRNYNKNAIPITNRTALPINVELKITLRRIIEMVRTFIETVSSTLVMLPYFKSRNFHRQKLLINQFFSISKFEPFK